MLLAYRRVLDGRDVLVMANFGREAVTVRDSLLENRRVLLSNEETVLHGSVTLAPSQALVVG